MPKLAELRNVQAREISIALNVRDTKEESLEERIRSYARKTMNLNEEYINLNFEDFFGECVDAIKSTDKQWFLSILDELENDERYKRAYKKLDRRLGQL